MQGTGYRADIDGLRALAVLAVIAYHFNFNGVSGGFVGVDIFFVISGYLISQIVRASLVSGSFSFASFYVRRIRRIAPAAIVMMFVTVAVGWYLLLPVDLRSIGRGLIANSFFVSNVLFWRESGYFDANSHLNLLLHTWSLAVEEQFYFFLPTALFLLRRRSVHANLAWVGLASLASFVLCVWMQGPRPTATFYLMPFRAWELGIGVLIALLHEGEQQCRLNCEVSSWVGLALLVYSLLFIQPGRTFPGAIAIVPVVGTGLLIYCGRYRNTVVSQVLSWSLLAALGRISYSLYLWHLPVYVYASYLNGAEPLGGWISVVGALTLVFAAASYKYVELPVRYGALGTRNSNIFIIYVSVTSLVLGLGVVIVANKGFGSRFSAAVVAYDSEREPTIPYQGCAKNLDRERADCLLGDLREAPTALLWGDSHALAWAPIVDELARGKESILFSYHSACPPLLDVINPASPPCSEYNDALLAFLNVERTIKKVVLHASWTSYSQEPGQYKLKDRQGRVGNDAVFANAMGRTIERLTEMGKVVVIVGPTPKAPADLPLKLAFYARGDTVAPPARTPYAEHVLRTKPFYTTVSTLPREYEVKVLDPARYLCDSSFCEYLQKGQLLYRDSGHLSYPGALFLSREKEMAQFLLRHP